MIFRLRIHDTSLIPLVSLHEVGGALELPNWVPDRLRDAPFVF